jgi:hypothetical protein
LNKEEDKLISQRKLVADPKSPPKINNLADPVNSSLNRGDRINVAFAIFSQDVV